MTSLDESFVLRGEVTAGDWLMTKLFVVAPRV